MHWHSRWISALSLALLGVLLVAAAAHAPGVSYSSTTSVKISGLLGSLLDKAGADEVSEESFFEDDKMATKNKTSRTVIDLNAETITTVDEAAMTYSVMTFDDFRTMLAGQTGETTEETPESEADYTVKINFWVDQPGVFEDVNGYRAELFRLHVVAVVEATAEEAGSDAADRGQFALAMELWLSDIDGYDVIQTFRQRYAEKMGQALGGGRSNLFDLIQKALGDDPAIQQSLDRSQEEIAAMDKMVVRQIMHVVTVPQGMTYDAEKVFGPEKKKKKKGLGGFAKKIAKQAAGVDAGGEPKAAEQKTVLTTITDHEGFFNGSLDATVFAVSSDYERVER